MNDQQAPTLPPLGKVICADCGAIVPRRGRRHARCTPCAQLRHREHQRANYQRTAEVQRAQRRERYVKNREQETGRSRAARYGLTPDNVQAMLDEQGGSCPICLRPLRLAHVNVDHCHSTGRIRGLLHAGCNIGIGQLGDDPDRCERAAAYLRSAAEDRRPGKVDVPPSPSGSNIRPIIG